MKILAKEKRDMILGEQDACSGDAIVLVRTSRSNGGQILYDGLEDGYDNFEEQTPIEQNITSLMWCISDNNA